MTRTACGTRCATVPSTGPGVCVAGQEETVRYSVCCSSAGVMTVMKTYVIKDTMPLLYPPFDTVSTFGQILTHGVTSFPEPDVPGILENSNSKFPNPGRGG